MAIIPKERQFVHEGDIYFQRFISKQGREYGLRFGTVKDVQEISTIFKEIYNYDYLTPSVYDLNQLRQSILEENNLWFVGEDLEKKEIAGTGLIKKKRYIAHMSKAVVKKKYQGLGVTSKIGAAGIISVTKMPQFNEVLRLDSEVRASQLGIQRLVENANAIPFAFVPAFFNYGDKRKHSSDDNTPYPSKREESAFLYSIILRNLWKKRTSEINLLDNDDFAYFHRFVRGYNRKMKNDDLIFGSGKKEKANDSYFVSRNKYDGIVNLYGTIHEKTLKNLLKSYKKWRMILWRIPTIQDGIHSMDLAIKKGFNLLGYDIGFHNVNWTLHDSVIMAFYRNRNVVECKVNCLDGIKPLFNKVRDLFYSQIN
ncbi:MAG: hypothetical protein ACXAAI_04785 [Promethearchaeota archaeon]